MVTRQQALAAIAEHQTTFARLGVHQVRAVELGSVKDSFAVHVRVPLEFSGEIPSHVEYKAGATTVLVPVVMERALKGSPE